ncbi:MAG TPA: PIN domain-containing protein [Candidatus Angelobacter sp.]|nr:PIN domain-containing protein [Candidatus Angelobacter sp.]
MKWFFDTSVLIPVFYADHPHHAASMKAYLSAGKDDFYALRTLAEIYSTLTGLPIRPRISGTDGIKFIRQIRDKLTVVLLTEQEYVSALEKISHTIVGAAVYDALIAQCAMKCDADVLLTWNVRDFVRFGPDVSKIIKTPLEL